MKRCLTGCFIIFYFLFSHFGRLFYWKWQNLWPSNTICLCDEVAYQKLFHPKPYLHLWEKEGVIQPQDRRDDSANCGGQPSDSNPMRVYNEESLQLQGETLWETRQRLGYQWQRCMLNKGYRFTGACYDNEISRDSPACMGRELISLP
jgi:hypothetical protein